MEQKEKFNPFVYIKGIPRRGKDSLNDCTELHLPSKKVKKGRMGKYI